jgi:hypothetical protein
MSRALPLIPLLCLAALLPLAGADDSIPRLEIEKYTRGTRIASKVAKGARRRSNLLQHQTCVARLKATWKGGGSHEWLTPRSFKQISNGA